jgi:hypothetical protein
MAKSSLKSQLDSISPGDLVCCSWSDASVGKSSGSGMAIDVPVKSWGVFVGVIGAKTKHIVLAQNSFRYSDGIYDLDYTAIPLGWATEVAVLVKALIPEQVAMKLIDSFSRGGHRSFSRPRTFQRRIFQQRLSIDGRPN